MPFFLLLLFITLSNVSFGQVTDSTFADCQTALQLHKRDSFNLHESPIGYGQIQEFSAGDKKSIFFPENENNSIWYQFEASRKAMMTIEIIPYAIQDDYDFSLYLINSDSICQQIQSKSILPLRSNFSRNNIDSLSITGLSVWAKDTFVGQGPQAVYSKYVDTKPGDRYLLMVNNIYPKGQGHQLKINYHIPIEIKGKVTDELGNALSETQVEVINTVSGDLMGQTITDSLGYYKLGVISSHHDISKALQIEFSKKDHFFKDTLIAPIQLLGRNKNIIHAKLKTLHIGDVYAINSILFYGNSPKPIKRSIPSIRSLVKTMKQNKTLQIEIIGHTNGCSDGLDFSMELSGNRVKTIFSYLKKGRIKNSRFRGHGIGCQQMLYPLNSRLDYLNRRVEIKVVAL